MIDLPPPIIAPALERRGLEAGCDGLIVSRIDVRTYRPSDRTAAERAAADATDAVGLEHKRTRAYVIRAYLRLKVGEPCTEQLRSESARLLRAQRFVASAAVTTQPDGAGGVRVRVDVVDEIPYVGSLRVRGYTPSAVRIGTQNWDGRGITVVAGIENAPGYRNGARFLVGQSGAFGRPALADAEWQRRSLGSLWRVTYAEPFLTDGQKSAAHVNAIRETLYPTLLRAGQEDVVVQNERAEYHAGWVRRVRGGTSGKLVGLGGLMVMGTEIRPGSALSVRSDSGLQPSYDSTLINAYRNHANGRVALVSGLRYLTFNTVTRFETLRAEQDIATGVEADALIGPSINRSGGARDVLIAGDLYLGRSGATSFISLKARGEGRVTGRNDTMEGVVGTVHLAWFRLTSPTRTRIVTATAAVTRNLAFPSQLSFRDADGGLVAFPEGGEGGSARAMLRVEERRLLPWLSKRAGLATAWVADVGRIWAGDAPFGVTSPLRGSLGVALLGSYPVTSKRTFRIDLAVPVNRGPRDASFIIRLSSGDRTGNFWSEPPDVSRLRASAGPISLMRW